MPMNEGRQAFEMQPCSRCGGSGWFSYCETWGRTCFQCGVVPKAQGSGRYLTKRGRAAYEYYVTLLPTRRTSELQPGDVILDGNRKHVVECAPVPTTSAIIRDGQRITEGYVDIQCKGVCLCLVPEDQVYSIVPSGDELQQCRDRALAYQGQLTKAGKVRKRQNVQPRAEAQAA